MALAACAVVCVMSAPPPPGMAAKVDAPAAELNEKIQALGEKIRAGKTAGKTKEELRPLIDQMRALKIEHREKAGPPGRRERGPPGKRDQPTGEELRAKRDSAFLAKFDKMVENSGLPDEELSGFREEMRSHSSRRLELSGKRRELKAQEKDGKLDKETVKQEMEKIDAEMKGLGAKHREIFDKIRKADPKFNKERPPRKERGDRPGRRLPGDKDESPEQMAERMAKSMEMRKKSIKDRSEQLLKAAKEAGFDEDEFAAIKEELDEFTAKELELVEKMTKQMPVPPRGKPGKGEKPPRRPDPALMKEMREVREARMKLQKRIREKEL